MRSVPRFAFGALAFAVMSLPGLSQIPAFPGAEGYGSHATGGRGRDVYLVTNRDASGAGSFSDAVNTAAVAGRTIVFAVSGHIRLPSGSGGGLSISKSKITVAGQTAPDDGVRFWNNSMNLTGDDLVIRNVRWRYGSSSAGGDAVDISGSQRIILDHCDVMFATDENLSSFGTPPEHFTFQWSINAWGLSGHSAGGLWDMDHATSHHCLWANNHTRNPKLIAPSVFDWSNNVTFGWDLGFNMAESPTGGTAPSTASTCAAPRSPSAARPPRPSTAAGPTPTALTSSSRTLPTARSTGTTTGCSTPPARTTRWSHPRPTTRPRRHGLRRPMA